MNVLKSGHCNPHRQLFRGLRERVLSDISGRWAMFSRGRSNDRFTPASGPLHVDVGRPAVELAPGDSDRLQQFHSDCKRCSPFVLCRLFELVMRLKRHAEHKPLRGARSGAEIRTSSRHRAERKRLRANRSALMPRRARSAFYLRVYAQTESREFECAGQAQATFPPGNARTSRRCSWSSPSIAYPSAGQKLKCCDLSLCDGDDYSVDLASNLR